MKLGVQFMEPDAIPANGQFARAGEFGPGSLLDDRFAITDVICNGGMASIYKANDLHNNGRVVAIKIPHRSAEADPPFSPASRPRKKSAANWIIRPF